MEEREVSAQYERYRSSVVPIEDRPSAPHLAYLDF
jgi:hypothetical protein